MVFKCYHPTGPAGEQSGSLLISPGETKWTDFWWVLILDLVHICSSDPIKPSRRGAESRSTGSIASRVKGQREWNRARSPVQTRHQHPSQVIRTPVDRRRRSRKREHWLLLSRPWWKFPDSIRKMHDFVSWGFRRDFTHFLNRCLQNIHNYFCPLVNSANVTHDISVVSVCSSEECSEYLHLERLTGFQLFTSDA